MKVSPGEIKKPYVRLRSLQKQKISKKTLKFNGRMIPKSSRIGKTWWKSKMDYISYEINKWNKISNFKNTCLLQESYLRQNNFNYEKSW